MRRSGFVVLMIGLLVLFAGSVTLLFGLLPADSVAGWASRLAGGLNSRDYDKAFSNMVSAQWRATVLGGFYIAAAVVWLLLGRRLVEAVFRDFRSLPSQFTIGRKHPDRANAASDRDNLFLLIATLVLVFGWVRYCNQTMRLDESTTFLSYGTRPLAFALGRYESTNNHILYSALMWFSVQCFGEAPWAIRLPAGLATAAIIPAIYWAGSRLIDRPTGLIAAGLFGGSLYSIDLATNARGYPLVLLAFVLILGLLPAVRQGRAASVGAMIVLAALGAWAVPVMIYPFSICIVWLLLRGGALINNQDAGSAEKELSWNGFVSTAVRLPSAIALFRIIGLTAAVGLLVAMLYGPTQIFVAAPGGNLSSLIRDAAYATVWKRIDRVFGNLWIAQSLWLHPWGGYAWLINLMGIIGGVRLIATRRTDACVLLIAVILGSIAVLAVTRIASPPWWSWGFLLPIQWLLVASALSWPWAVQWTSGQPRMATGPLAIAATTLLIGALSSRSTNYPAGMPYYVGFLDAPAAADQLIAIDGVTPNVPVIALPTVSGSINYYFYRAEGSETRRVVSDPSMDRLPERLIAVSVQKGVRINDQWQPHEDAAFDGYQAIKRQQFDSFELREFRRLKTETR